MKRLLIVFVLACIVFFVGGFIFVRLRYLTASTYITIASVAGALASVTGLLSLARPSISRADVETLEVDSLRKVAELSEQIEHAKQQRTETEEEIARLAEQKEEIQFLVRKASLALFLQDQMEQKHTRIAEIIQQNKELESLIQEYSQTVDKLSALNEEINADKNVDTLREIMMAARKRTRPKGIFDFIVSMTRELAEISLGRVVR
jgi:chromosome segregation ATPase